MASRRPVRRVISWLSRRMDRPELLAAFYPGARRAWREEIAIAAIFASALRSDAGYVDVGTNRGQLLELAVRAAPEGRHIAFEPIADLGAEVRARFPQVDVRGVALSDRPGTHEFWHFRRLDGWSGLRRSPQISDEAGDPHRLEVPVSTLDQELAGRSPALVKIDVEGAELGVLQGGRELLARVKPIVIVECVPEASALYGSSPQDVWDLLDGLGYELFAVTGGEAVGRSAFGGEASVNWLARPRVEHAAGDGSA
jgi:FkbM family methyltransferase